MRKNNFDATCTHQFSDLLHCRPAHQENYGHTKESRIRMLLMGPKLIRSTVATLDYYSS
jgi:hypothetical protein